MTLHLLLLASVLVRCAMGASVGSAPVVTLTPEEERALFESSRGVAGSRPIDMSGLPGATMDLDLENVILFQDYMFDQSGWLDKWDFYAATAGEIKAAVFRPRRSSDTVKLIGYNILNAVMAGQVNEYEVPLMQRIRVSPGDYIGLAWSNKDEPVISMRKQGPERNGVKLSKVHSLDVPLPSSALTERFEHPVPKNLPNVKYAASIQASLVGGMNSLRLVEGDGHRSGIAEIMEQDNIWGRICDLWVHTYGWPHLFCKSLGFPGSEEWYYHNGNDNTIPLYMNNLRCKPSDGVKVPSCDQTPYTKCDHDSEVFVKCERLLQLKGGDTDRCRGIPSIWQFGYWGTVCDQSYQNHDPTWHLANWEQSWTTAFCRELECSQKALSISYATEMTEELGNFYNPEKETYRNPNCLVPSPNYMAECPPHAGQNCASSAVFYIICADSPVFIPEK